MRPMLKWLGNKYRIVQFLNSILPKNKRLVEPFAGSLALFLNTDYDAYLLNDINKDLINFYITLSTYKKDFIEYCKSFFTQIYNNKAKYLELRAQFNKTNDAVLKSALFLYLNRHGYNGLCRYNSAGKFNTPFGRYTKPYFPEKEMNYFLEKVSKSNVVFTSDNYKVVLNKANQNDVLYMDPPYMPLSKTSNFTQYSSNNFTIEDQIDLAKFSEMLAEKGVFVAVSNHDTELTRELYRKAKIYEMNIRRNVSCKERKKVREILAIFEAI